MVVWSSSVWGDILGGSGGSVGIIGDGGNNGRSGCWTVVSSNTYTPHLCKVVGYLLDVLC